MPINFLVFSAWEFVDVFCYFATCKFEHWTWGSAVEKYIFHTIVFQSLNHEEVVKSTGLCLFLKTRSLIYDCHLKEKRGGCDFMRNHAAVYVSLGHPLYCDLPPHSNPLQILYRLLSCHQKHLWPVRTWQQHMSGGSFVSFRVWDMPPWLGQVRVLSSPCHRNVTNIQ